MRRLTPMILILFLLMCGLASADTVTVDPVPITAGVFQLAPIAVALTANTVLLTIVPGSFGDVSQVLDFIWEESTDGVEYRLTTGSTGFKGGVHLSRGGVVITKFPSRVSMGSIGTTYFRLSGTLTGADITMGLEVTY